MHGKSQCECTVLCAVLHFCTSTSLLSELLHPLHYKACTIVFPQASEYAGRNALEL